MKPELIVMLTHHDQTVENAEELFASLKETPVTHWGFKDVGLPHDQMNKLVRQMRAAGKVTYLEVVSLSEQEGLTMSIQSNTRRYARKQITWFRKDNIYKWFHPSEIRAINAYIELQVDHEEKLNNG